MAKNDNVDKKKSGAAGIISFFLLLAAAGAVFYFGWVQFELPENTYAVMFSKTGGYDDQVLEPGRFNWKWERILPTNSKLIKVKIEPRSTVLDFEGNLPSGDLYGTFLPQKPDFSYKMTFNLTYRLREDRLPQLLRENVISESDLSVLYDSVESEYMKVLKKGTNDFFNENLSIDNTSFGDMEAILLDKVKSRYTYFDIRSFAISYINFPDLELYGKTRDIYHQMLDRKKETEIATEKWAIESKVNLDTKIEILTRYGELLSKYPILVDYFALDPESQVLDISNLRDYKYESGSEGDL